MSSDKEVDEMHLKPFLRTVITAGLLITAILNLFKAADMLANARKNR